MSPNLQRSRRARSWVSCATGLASVLMLLSLNIPAHAHLGHLGELGGHSHWVGAAALAGAAVLAGIAAWKGRKEKRKDEEKAPSDEPGDAEPEAA